MSIRQLNILALRPLIVHQLPHGLVVRIRRSHRRGPGSIPGVGIFIVQFFSFSLFQKNHKLSNIFIQERFFHTYFCHCLITFQSSYARAQKLFLDFHLSSKIRNQIEDSNLNHFTASLRSKRFQSIYCAKVRAEAKKSYAGYFTGNVRT